MKSASGEHDSATASGDTSIAGFRQLEGCRVTDSRNLIDILDLGAQPLANSLKSSADEEQQRFPLRICFCPDSSLLQLDGTVEKEALFDDYVWVSGTSPSTRSYAEKFCQRVIDVVGLSDDELVIEIASNDGTFLSPFIGRGFSNVMGVDPAANIAKIAQRNGVNTLNAYWNRAVAEQLVAQRGKAKVVIARNVLPHVSELLDVVAGIENALADRGIGVIEFHSAEAILDGLQYDSIYHEHLSYFSIQSISLLMDKFGLYPFHLHESAVSGGSHVLYFSKMKLGESEQLAKGVQREVVNQVNELESWVRFAKNAYDHRRRTLELVNACTGKFVGFGASARSQTYLNFCGVDSSKIQAVIDNNPLKQGSFCPGSSIPIVSIDDGMGVDPDVILILAWNFRDEICMECRDRGFRGQFLVPFPDEPRLLEVGH